jgi:DNA-binding Lrp family transcriptional regulator
MEKYQLDAKDRRLLSELDTDAMQPASRIAKKARMSKQVVGYRINALQEASVLRECCIVVDSGKLGYTVFKLYLKYRGVDKKMEERIVERLSKSPNVGLLETCDGRWDMIVGVWARDLAHFRQVSGALFRGMEEHFAERIVSTIERAEHLGRAYLLGRRSEGKALSFGSSQGAVAGLEVQDRKMLQALATDARKSMVKVSAETGIEPQAARRRLLRLKENGVVSGARILIDRRRIGMLGYKVLLTLENMTPAKEKELLEYLRQQPNVVDVVYCLGNWNFELDVEIGSYEEFHYLMLEMRNRFSDVLRNYESLLIFEEQKYNYFPMGVRG